MEVASPIQQLSKKPAVATAVLKKKSAAKVHICISHYEVWGQTDAPGRDYIHKKQWVREAHEQIRQNLIGKMLKTPSTSFKELKKHALALRVSGALW